MLEEAQKLGFYSAWNDIRREVDAFPGEELLVVADVEEVYGENWYICLTEEAKAAYFYVRWRARAVAVALLPSTRPPCRLRARTSEPPTRWTLPRLRLPRGSGLKTRRSS
jgi:hypothetical protein